ncbi:XRE family transcriptional regulator [uncultured Sphaerochaeta sp.]|uniref:helix-turn-helix domain-containing protein n=1 Tax=uncultured Sphaerochaeta sp. TaxID=886478 RepID=UPI002A0A8018|nr:XRE family transcriptional regulator [uncultured Sphaerochaeta sp.]
MNVEYIGKNLRRQIKQKGKTIQEVALAAGISKVALSNILTGKSTPKSGTVIKLASCLNISIDTLLVIPVSLHAIRFRTAKVLSPREKASKEQILLDIPVWLGNYRQLENLLGKSSGLFLPDVKDLDEIEAAHLVRDIAQIKAEAPLCDLVGLVSQLGIKLWLHDFKMKRIFGLSVGIPDGGPAIIVNDNPDISIERKIFTIAHELGHLLFHLASYIAPLEHLEENDEEETQANIFAGELLLPAAGLKKQWEQYKGIAFIDRVLAIKHLYKVSYKTVLYGLIRDGLYKGTSSQLYIDFSQGYRDKYGHDLKNHYEPSEGQSFVAKIDMEPLQKWDLLSTEYQGLVRDAYRNGYISITKAAEMLSLDLSAMRKLQASWEYEADE